MWGGPGADRIYGDAGTDTLYGEAGNDILTGGTGVSYLYGGEADDTLHYGPTSGSLAAVGNALADSLLDGGSGRDALHIDNKATSTLDGETAPATRKSSSPIRAREASRSRNPRVHRTMRGSFPGWKRLP